MISGKTIKKALLVALWFAFLTFPIMVIKVNPYEETVVWRWQNMLFVTVAAFILYLVGRAGLKIRMAKEQRQQRVVPDKVEKDRLALLLSEPKFYLPFFGAILVAFTSFPFLLSTYQINILITALMYVVLGLGLNIVVGMAGLLDLGYVAFYAVGAYSYALLNLHFGIGFWTALPLGGMLAACFGIILGFPVLRLRGDYLAIVTLGFGEIIRLVLENWSEFSNGPSGISAASNR